MFQLMTTSTKERGSSTFHGRVTVTVQFRVGEVSMPAAKVVASERYDTK